MNKNNKGLQVGVGAAILKSGISTYKFSIASFSFWKKNSRDN